MKVPFRGVHAVPYRSELRAGVIGGIAAVLLGFAALATIAVAGGIDALDARWYDAIAIAGAVVLAAALYGGTRRKLRARLAAPGELAPEAERLAPQGIRWRRTLLGGVVGGLVLGGAALALDFDVDNLAVVLAVALGGLIGEDVAGLVAVARHEREHGRTVYRVEDPAGEDAGLALG